MRKSYTRKDVIAMLNSQLKGLTLAELGRRLDPKHPVSATYLNDVLRGRKRPGKRILEPLGLERETLEVYRRVSKALAA